VFLTIPEAATLLRKPVSWLYKRTKELPAYGGGKRLVFDREELLAWYRERFALGRPRRIGRTFRRVPHAFSGGQGHPQAQETPVAMRGSGNGREDD